MSKMSPLRIWCKKTCLSHVGILLVILLLCFASRHSQAQSFQLQAIKTVPVYKSPKGSKENRFLILKPGEKALISPQKYGAWRKLLITHPGQPAQKGWVHIKHIKSRAKIKKVEEEEEDDFMDHLDEEITAQEEQEEIKNRHWQHRPGLGVSLHGSYLTWGKRSFTLSDETEWTVSEVTSTTYWPSIFIELPIWSRTSFRFYTGYRTAEFEGESSTAFIGTKQTSFLQTFLSLGLVYKGYFENKKTWWGFGAEGAQGQKLIIAYDNTEIPASKDDLPLFIILFATGGMDFKLTHKLFLLPEFRLGTVYNQDPKIYFIEGVLSLGWSL